MAENEQNGELNRPHCNERYIDAARLIEPCFADHEQTRHAASLCGGTVDTSPRARNTSAPAPAPTPIMKLLE
jgi:hypothetical protein